MQIDPPHMIDSALVIAYRYHLWRVNGAPEVWHHVPYKKSKTAAPEVPAHWERIIAVDAIPRLDAKQALAQAWKQDSEWRDAYAGQK